MDTATADPTDARIAGLAALFAPRAIAILGASGGDGMFAGPLRYLTQQGYDGAVYPVNPNYETLRGLPCYPSLADLPEPVDLVLMMISASAAVREIPAVAGAGAKAAIVFASGFAETGPEGRALQERLQAQASAHGIRLLGPNCQGVVAPHTRMAATFTAALDLGMPTPGSVAYVGQSGAVGGSILSLAHERGLGIGAWASTGNQADLDALEIGRYLLDDARIRVLMMYLESPVDGRRYAELAGRAAELGKSVLVLRSALSQSGKRAASSHTGAMIGDGAAFGVASRAFGVLEADDVDDFIATAHALSVLPRAAGRNIGIVTTSGGAGSLAADQAELAGLSVGQLEERTQRELAATVPDFGAVGNPVDVTAQLFRDGSDEFVRVCDAVLADPTVDAVLITMTMVTGELATSVAADLAALWERARKPVLVVWLAAREQTAAGRSNLRTRGWPVLDSLPAAMKVLRALSTPCRQHRPVEVSEPDGLGDALADVDGHPVVTESRGHGLLATLGVDRPEQRLARSREEAREAARLLGEPVVMKIESTTVLHKTDRGGVRLGVTVDDAAAVYDELTRTFAADGPDGVLVQEQAGAGPELVVGVTDLEPGFPPLVTVGIGGIATELYQDTVTRLAPVDEAGALAMLHELRAAPLLTGYRGTPGVRLDAAARAVSRLSLLAGVLGGRLAEAEVNPLRLVAGGDRAVALDFLLRTTTDGAHRRRQR